VNLSDSFSFLEFPVTAKRHGNVLIDFISSQRLNDHWQIQSKVTAAKEAQQTHQNQVAELKAAIESAKAERPLSVRYGC